MGLRLALRWKLVLTHTLVAAASVLVGWIGLANLHTLAGGSEAMLHEGAEPLGVLVELSTDSQRVRIWLRELGDASTQGDVEKMVGKVRERQKFVQDGIASLRKFELPDEIRNKFEEFVKLNAAYDAIADRVIGFMREDKIDDAEAFIAEDALKAAMKSRAALGEVTTALVAHVGTLATANEAARESSTRQLIATVVGAFLLALLIGFVAANSIAKPVRDLSRAARGLAQGDLAQEVTHQSHDEVGALADAFRGLIDYLGEMATAADAVAAGDLAKDVTTRSDRDRLAKSFAGMQATMRGLLTETGTLITAAKAGELSRRGDPKRFDGAFRALLEGINSMLDAVVQPIDEARQVLDRVAARDLTARVQGQYNGDHARVKEALNLAVENLATSLGQVSEAAAQVANASTQIANTSQDVARGASTQASALEQTSASLEEMAGVTKKSAESARRANQVAEEARTTTELGRVAIGQMTEAMGRMREAARSTAAIIRDINDISFQTNLLALNAAVEAARAGDMGRGFAVVAEEVRNLAQRSKKAAQKTEQLINESVELSQQGELIAREAQTNLDAVVSSVTNVTGIVAELATASDGQAAGIGQLNQAVGNIDKVTQSNAAASEESASAAQELSSQSMELQALVGRFQLGGRKPAPRLVPPPRPAGRTNGVAKPPARSDFEDFDDFSFEKH